MFVHPQKCSQSYNESDANNKHQEVQIKFFRLGNFQLAAFIEFYPMKINPPVPNIEYD